MKIIIKEGKIILPRIPVIRVTEPIKIDTEYVKDPMNKRLSLSINGKNIGKIDNFEFMIPKQYLLEDDIQFTITEEIIANGDIKTYVSKKFPINIFTYLGKDEVKLYPKVIKELLYRVTELEEQVELIKNEGDLI